MATHDYRQRQIGRQELHPETLVISYGYDLFLSEGAVKQKVFTCS